MNGSREGEILQVAIHYHNFWIPLQYGSHSFEGSQWSGYRAESLDEMAIEVGKTKII